MKGLWAIILAAGESKRMGFPKMLLNFNGKTMLERVILNVTGSRVDKTLVVLGAENETITEIVSNMPVVYCYNKDFKEGMLSSVKCGFNHLPSDFRAVMVFQGDQPLITPEVINILVKEYSSADKGIIIPVYNKKRGHPVLIDRRFINDIELLDSNNGLRSLAYMFPAEVLEVEIDDPGILRDFDTYEEYKNELNKMK